jgi:hypothetical protein
VSRLAGSDEFIARRLRAQRLSSPMAPDPAAIVGWFGAVQAQDYVGAKQALWLRAPGLTDAAIDRALADGSIIRTHGPRPTWHFIAAADARWVLAAVGPRVLQRSQTMFKAHGIDAAVMARCRRAIEKTLGGGRCATRTALAAAFKDAGVEAATVRLGLIVMWAELDQVICSGPREGKQFTYALFDERATGERLAAEDARTALAQRYVQSHGPVTIRDFVWWSGLTTGEARRAFESVSPALRTETIDGALYWSSPKAPPAGRGSVAPVHLLPNYDEYFIAYRDREPTAEAAGTPHPIDPNSGYWHVMAIGGRLGGFWKRTIDARKAAIELVPHRPLSRAHRASADEAVERYGGFIGLPITVTARAAKRSR